MKRLPTPEELREHLVYEPSTGVFSWKPGARGNQWRPRAGGPVRQNVCKDGYLKLSIFGRNMYAHRVAWAYMTGEWPTALIDHRNTDRADNRWLNLRPATNAANLWNRGKPVNNTSGIKGVSLHKASGLWMVRVNANGGFRNAYAKTLEEAAALQRKMIGDLHGEFGRAA